MPPTSTSQNISYYPESWYPICLLSEIKKGKSKAIQLFGTEWLLFRTQDGTLGLIHRFCPHMGTDLANGKVKGNSIECPLHDWRLNADGSRGGDSSSGKTSQILTKHLKVTERYGIIFVFWGKSPTFELPSFADVSNPISSKPVTLNLKNDYIAVILNAFDTQHLTAVHNRIIDGPVHYRSQNSFHLGIQFTVRVKVKSWRDRLIRRLGMGTSELQYDCWGGNIILVRSLPAKYLAILSMLPGENDNESKFFLVVIRQSKAKNFVTRFFETIRLSITSYFAMRFLSDDIEVIKNMHPKKGMLSPEYDQAVARFWTYMENIPRYIIDK